MSKQNKITWSVVTKKVSDLSKNNYNPRLATDKDKADLKNSISEFGVVVPIVLNIGSRENIVIGGEQRINSYLDLGIKEVECMIPSRELTLEEEQKLNLRLNKNVGSWDLDLLKNFDLDTLLDVGFDDEYLNGIFDDVETLDDNYDVEKAKKEITEPRAKTGEIWQLGDHKLLVGDSTDLESVQRLMGTDKADIVYEDSPYNIGLSYSKGIGGNGDKYGGSFTSKDDSKKDEDFFKFLEKSLEVAKQIAKTNCHYFYWCDSSNLWMLQTLYNKMEIENKRVCMWIKNNQNPTPKISFNKVYEPCVYGITGKPYLNSGIKNANEILNQEVTSGNQLHDEIQEMFDIWMVKRDNVSEYLHPTQKPVTLNEKPFKRCSAPGHIIFSGFGGSGSDLIACEQLKRKWRGVEKDEIFATIIIDRWEKFTNQKATLCK
jgi:DNA modification methylase